MVLRQVVLRHQPVFELAQCPQVIAGVRTVRRADHYGLRPDFCQAADAESEGIAGNLAGYAEAT